MTAQARLLGGRYQVGELLGYGGMAEVHRGRDLRLGRDVAIKMLRTDLARDPTFQERFRREAQNSAALNHPAIVAVYDTGEEISAAGEKQPFIVMEFVNGRTLKEVLAQEQRLQPRKALETIADICAALEFSHRHGIIHRDIKPGNVMITQSGQVKVMDFGIARALASGATTMTQTSAVIGTAQYLSPEQARGEAVDARSDVYAAGCVLFELVVGHPPFVGDSPVSVAYQHVREDPKSPSSINHEVPPEVDAIALKALAKNPLNRYQSAQEMRADALRAVSGRPVMATPVMSEAETVAMSNGPRQWQPQAATTMQRPIQNTMGGPQQDSRQSWVWAALAGLGVLVVIVLGVALALNKNNKDDDVKPPAQATMPNLKGLTEQQALQKLTDAGLTAQPKIDTEKKQDCNGEVSQQTPAASTASIPADTQTGFTICNALDKVTVPSNLVGATRANAEAALKERGLVPDVREVASSAPKGQVVDVEKQGEQVDPGTRITIKVSNNQLVIMPDVVGQTEDVASALLSDRGLNPVTKIVPGDGTQPPGTVISQSKKAKSKVEVGTNITIEVVGEETPDPGQSSASPDPTDTSGAGGGVGQ